MYRRNDPRLRRTLNELSETIESANVSAQAGLFDFNQKYIAPCLANLGECFSSCGEACFGSREEHRRRQRRNTRGRAELNFDFYDDWDDEDDSGLLGWDNNDELDRLLAGSGAVSSRRARTEQQPGRQRGMNYGTVRRDKGRRKGAIQPHDGGPDPTSIPASSMLGFMERLPWKFGAKSLKYKPSVADLQDHPGGYHSSEGEEGEPLMEGQEDDIAYARRKRKHKRDRSDTNTSGQTAESLSSRGDIFPSEDEIDDAQPLDDEFELVLERRTTSLGSDEASSKQSRSGKTQSGSRMSLRTSSSKSTPNEIQRTLSEAPSSEEIIENVPTLVELKNEEDQAREEQEAEVQKRRFAAQQLAMQKGLRTDVRPKVELRSEALPSPQLLHSPEPKTGTESFPIFDARAQSVVSPLVSEPATRIPEVSEQQSVDNFIPAQLPRFGPG